MFWKSLLFAGNSAFLIILLLQATCHAEKNHSCENPSSCGHLFNISYPFRLKGDPPNCGDPNYELTCDNNQLFLNLYSGKYYVKAINYDDSIIRLADVGVQDGNCSSLPLYSLNYRNFSFGHQYWPSYIAFQVERGRLVLCWRGWWSLNLHDLYSWLEACQMPLNDGIRPQ